MFRVKLVYSMGGPDGTEQSRPYGGRGVRAQRQAEPEASCQGCRPAAASASQQPPRAQQWPATAGPVEEIPMVFSGQVLVNPLSGERFACHTTAGDSAGELLTFDLVVEPHGRVPAGPVPPAPPGCLEVLAGTMRFAPRP